MLHPSAHLLLDCGEILWPQRGRIGGPHPQPLSHFAGEGSQLDLPVRPGNKHLLAHAAVKVDTGRHDVRGANRGRARRRRCRVCGAWAGGRLILAFLTLLEPLVRFTLTTLATLASRNAHRRRPPLERAPAPPAGEGQRLATDPARTLP